MGIYKAVFMQQEGSIKNAFLNADIDFPFIVGFLSLVFSAMVQYSFGLLLVSNIVATIAILSLTVGVLLQVLSLLRAQRKGEVC